MFLSVVKWSLGVREREREVVIFESGERKTETVNGVRREDGSMLGRKERLYKERGGESREERHVCIRGGNKKRE